MTSERHVLVTGFGPFEDVCLNASGLVAARLDAARIAGVTARGAVLPTAFGEARARVGELVRADGCCAALALGVWRGADWRLERRARGVVASARADVRGEVWEGRTLGPDAASSYMIDAWAAAVGARVSEDAGGYVCNATYHALLAAADGKPAVFVHMPRDVGASGLAASEAIARAVIALLVGAA